MFKYIYIYDIYIYDIYTYIYIYVQFVCEVPVVFWQVGGCCTELSPAMAGSCVLTNTQLFADNRG